jgi:hypothetical protein
MPDTSALPPKGKGTIGGIKKEYVYIGGGLVVIVFAAVYYRSKKQADTASATGNVTDPAGNVCTALDPNSGYCPGSQEDLAYQGTGASGSLVGQDSSSYVGGQIIGYDQYGNPIYSSGPNQNTGPGSFTNNAAWSQAAIEYMQGIDSNVDASVIAAALGAYVNGEAVTADQKSLVEQAIAFENYPPVAGKDGYPPQIKDVHTVIKPITPPTTIKKPVAPKPKVTKILARDVTVSWARVPNATGYIVQLSGRAVFDMGDGIEHTFGNLTPNHHYSYKIWAQNKAGKSSPGTGTFTTKKK